GGNRWVVCDDTIKSAETRHQAMAAQIRSGMQANQFHAWLRRSYGWDPVQSIPFAFDPSSDILARPDRSFAGLPILLVDDQAADLEITKDRLLEAGYQHVTCVNGGAAAISFLDQIDSLAANDTAGAAPGVVVVDIRMPPPDGYDVLARIKAMAADRRPLALAVTGDRSSDTRVAALRSGATDFIGKSLDAVELLVRVRNLSEMKVRQLELDHHVRHDVLTGLADRAEVMRFLKDALRARVAGESVSVLLVDVDGFKDVNEPLSQAAGDEVWVAVARQLTAAVRPQDWVGRIGDDEFVVVLPAATDGQGATVVAERVRSRVETIRFEQVSHDLVVTISVGIAVSHSRSTPESLLSDADAALDRAKTSGGNRWVVCDDTIKSAETRHQAMAAQIRSGMQANQFHAWLRRSYGWDPVQSIPFAFDPSSDILARPDRSFAGLPILLVDDQAADLEITKDRLLEAGYQHVTCVNGGAAAISFLDQIDSLAANDTAGAAPGVVVVDIRMPPPDGYDVLARIKAMAADRRPLALAVTGDRSSDTRVAALRSGATDFIGKSLDAVELLVRVRNLSEMKVRQLELDHHVRHDVLTGLADRAEVMRFLKDALRARVAGESVSVLLVDVDGFKDVNEPLSQAAGDEVWVAVARQLTAAVRPQDWVGRIGDDEFVVVLPAATDGQGATVVAERVRSRVETIRFEQVSHDLVVTISVGIAVSHSRSTPESLLSDADAALARAKTSGGNRWVVCDDTIKSAETRRQ
ncbi:MAG: diguanylate cyclase, partial [Mycobacterium sp.]